MLIRLLHWLGLRRDPGSRHAEGRIIACAYPRRRQLEYLADIGVRRLINLSRRGHAPTRLTARGLSELHLPVPDFIAPDPEQLAAGVRALQSEIAAGRPVAIHCDGGYGRTGTLLACYYVSQGLDPAAAIARVRAERPGALETKAQLAAVSTFATAVSRPKAPLSEFYFYPANRLPAGFSYPAGFVALARAPANLAGSGWWLLGEDPELAEMFWQVIRAKGGSKSLIPFAKDDDSGDIACFDAEAPETVYFDTGEKNYADIDWSRRYRQSFAAWLASASAAST